MRVLAALVMLAGLATPALAAGAGSISVEFNDLQPAEKGCRAVFVLNNGLEKPLADLTLRVVAFDKEQHAKLFLSVATGALRVGKTRILRFDLGDNIACTTIGRLVLDDVTKCEGAGLDPAACLAAIKLASRAGIPFDLLPVAAGSGIMASVARLRLIHGSHEPRAAVASVPEIGTRERTPFEAPRRERFLAGAAVSLLLHGALIAAWMDWTGSDEARSKGGSDETLVIDGVSIVMLDSIASQGSQASLAEARLANETAAISPPEMAAVASKEEPAPSEGVAEARPEATTAVVSVAPVDTPPVAAEPGLEPPASLEAEAVPDEVGAAAPSATVVQADDEAAQTAQIPDPQSASLRNETAVGNVPPDVVTEAPSVGTPRARAITDHAVAAVEVEPEPSPEAAPRRDHRRDRPKPAATAVAAAPARPASIAEPVGRSAEAGSGGAGGKSAEETGRAALSSYQAALAAHLRRFRTFPEEARKRGLTGTAVVRFTVNSGGALVSASLGQSSGEGLLDGEAVAMVRRASPFPPIPDGMGRSTVTISAPVRFDFR